MSFRGGRGGGGGRGGRRPGFNKRGHAKGNKAPPAAHFQPHLKAIFIGRPPLLHKPPMPRMPPTKIGGVADFVKYFETTAPPKRKTVESAKQQRERLRKEKKEQAEKRMAEEAKAWDPNHPEAGEAMTKNALATLFVARLDYRTTEANLSAVLEEFGKIKKIRLVHDTKTEKPRGYAFIEFESEDAVKNAYRHAEGRRVHGRKIRVDVERGRTVPNWKPRRLGGGKGSSRMDKPPKRGAAKKSRQDHRGHRGSNHSKRKRDIASGKIPPPKRRR
jgi:U1 small nuclear ribonucleoprotein 70kDa